MNLKYRIGGLKLPDYLSTQELLALEMRFESNRTIFDIAKTLNLTWDEADHLIDRALAAIRSQVRKAV